MFKRMAFRPVLLQALLLLALATLTQGSATADTIAPALLQNQIAGIRSDIDATAARVNSDNLAVTQARLNASYARVAADTSTDADVSAAQATGCRTLSKVQLALTGGLALKPAPYGITYISIAGLIAPLFFPSCDATQAKQSPKTTELKNQEKTADDAIADAIKLRDVDQALLLQQYQQLNQAVGLYLGLSANAVPPQQK